jgi:hypothetical protein
MSYNAPSLFEYACIANHGVNNAQEGNGGDNGAAEKTNDDSNEVCAAVPFFNIRYQIIIWTDEYSPNGQPSSASCVVSL